MKTNLPMNELLSLDSFVNADISPDIVNIQDIIMKIPALKNRDSFSKARNKFACAWQDASSTIPHATHKVKGALYEQAAWLQELFRKCVKIDVYCNILVYNNGSCTVFRIFVDTISIEVIDKYSDLYIDAIKNFPDMNCDFLVFDKKRLLEERAVANDIILEY